MIGYWGVSLGGTGIWIGITLAFMYAIALLTTRFKRVLATLALR